QYEQAPSPRRAGRGLTEYVLRIGKSLHVTPDVIQRLESVGEAEIVGKLPVDWVGVPLKSKLGTTGVLVVQSYTQGATFTEEDRIVIEFISIQVAMAIER